MAPPPGPGARGPADRRGQAGTEVALVAWPAEEDLRRRLAARRRPRLLLVGPDAPPPSVLDELEDWLREPVPPSDVAARSRELLRRLEGAERAGPVLDADGILRHDGRWVAVPDGQIPVLRLLLDRVDRVVTSHALRVAYEAGGGSGHPSSIRTLVARLDRRVRQVGLSLVTIRGRGVVLATAASTQR